MLPPLEELKTALEELLPGVAITIDDGSFLIGASDLTAVCRCLKDTERFHLDYLANLTAIDYLPDLPALSAVPSGTGQAGAPSSNQTGAAQAGRIELVYHLYSMAKKHGPVTLKVKLPRGNPTVVSVTPIWRGAEFQEREAYDLYGVTFTGHPDLRRILMWDGFSGYPMRKDYVPEDQDTLEHSV